MRRVVLWCAVVVIVVGAAATFLGTAHGGTRAPAHHAGTRTLKFVYSGSGFVQVRQHIDNIPGHAGSEYDDTYSKQVKWSIAWEVTIEDERVLVGDPTATVSGTASADKNSGFGLGSCSAPVKMLVVAGKPFVPTTFEVIGRTQQFLTVRLEGTGAFGSFPVAWAATSCLPAQNITGYVTSPANGAGSAWGKSWGAPEFKIALFNNYKITPASIGNTYPFPVELPIKKIVFDWNARLTIAGYGSNPNPPPKPPAKKPCTPGSGKPTSLTQAAASEYLRKLAQWIEKFGNDLQAKIPYLPPDWQRFAREKLDYECSRYFRPSPWYGRRLPYLPPPPPPAPPDLEDDSFQGVDVESSPDVLNASAGGPGARSSTTFGFTPMGIAAFRSGKPLTVTLKGVFRVKGKPPITATATVRIKGRIVSSTAGISSVTFDGSVQNPSIVIHGRNLGKQPAPNPSGSPSNQPPLCPVTIQGNAGLDYGTSLYLTDDTRRFAAGRYRPSVNELDCVGLSVTKFTPTEVDYLFGSYYAQVYPQYAMQPGDSVQVAVNGATKTVHVKYGATVTS